MGLFATDIFILTGTLFIFSDNIWIFLIGRVVMGFGCGIAPMMAALYIKNFCPKEIYAFISGLNPLSYNIFNF